MYTVREYYQGAHGIIVINLDNCNQFSLMEQNDEDFCSTSISIIGHVSAISNVVMIGRAKHAECSSIII